MQNDKPIPLTPMEAPQGGVTQHDTMFPRMPLKPSDWGSAKFACPKCGFVMFARMKPDAKIDRTECPECHSWSGRQG